MATGVDESTMTQVAYDARLLRRLAGFLRPYAWRLAASILLLMAVSVLQLAGPYLVKIAVDNYIVPGRTQGFEYIVLVYAAILLVTFILQYTQFYTMQSCGHRIMHDVRMRLFTHLQKMSLSFYNRTPAGQVITSIVNDVETLNDILTQGIVEIVGSVIILITITVAMLFLDTRLALMTLAVLVPVLIATKLYRTRARRVYRRIRDCLARLNTAVHESASGMSTIQVFNKENENAARFERINRENRDEQLKSIFYYALYFPIIDIFSAAAVGLVIWYGGGDIVRQALQLGVLIAFIQYVQRFFQPVKDLAGNYNVMQSAASSLERIFTLLDTPDDIPDPAHETHPVPGGKLKGQIEFRNVWFSYNAEPALKGINFRLDPGESVAIVGATGAGKTSIINLIGRFYDIQEGSILIDGMDIRGLKKAFLRQHIGFVLQDTFLFSGSVERNIRLGDTTMPEGRVREAARCANAAGFIEKLPAGYHHELHERGDTLSLGQKQLISIARVFAFDPEILILDEATSSLDSETEMLIRDAMQKVIRNRTTIIIAHRLSTVRFADRVIVMHEGEIAQMGTHEQLVRSEGIYRNLYELQFGHEGPETDR
jgi:ATP-binding cassette subfamily B protein